MSWLFPRAGSEKNSSPRELGVPTKGARALSLPCHQERGRWVSPGALRVKSNFPQGGELVIKGKVGVFGGPLLEVLIGTLFLDCRKKSDGWPISGSNAPAPSGLSS